MIIETEPVHGLVALMAIFGGDTGDWTVVEKAGEIYLVPADAGRAASAG